MIRRRRAPGAVLESLTELLCDSVMAKTDEEIIAEAQEEYGDVDAHVERLRAGALQHLERHKKTRLTTATPLPIEVKAQQRPSRYASRFTWTNRSVRKFASGADPIEKMEDSARAIVVQAMDKGWRGPPFDPIRLAELLGYEVEARADVKEARVLCRDDGRFKIEFNPNRPQGRIHFSIAHEIAHTLFPDCRERVRYRGKTTQHDEWQVETLCNIAAAELLMPVGSFVALRDVEPSIEQLLDARKQFHVSAEAVLIRYAKLADRVCAAFGASATGGLGSSRRYRLDYLIASRNWAYRVPLGQLFSQISPLAQCVAIGFTAKGVESKLTTEPLKIEAVGLPPYPGQLVPRVAGVLSQVTETVPGTPRITYLRGNALEPRGTGNKIIAHIVNDKTPNWGGAGFASAVRRKWPHVHAKFAFRVVESDRTLLQLGSTDWQQVDNELFIFTIVAQHGYGPSPVPRIRYSALETGLHALRERAKSLGASVHLPRIGAGHAGGAWELIEGIIEENLVHHGIPATVYDLPD